MKNNSKHPSIIQGGMGAGVSDWNLARAVSRAGQLGVVAGTALDVILTRRLQLGDSCGSMRRALAALPLDGVAERILVRYFVEGGKPADRAFKLPRLLDAQPSKERTELIIAANFVEVHLAKQGHSGLVGINYLAKIPLPSLPSLYGAMLAGVDYVLMGAGIPRTIPGILDDLSLWKPVRLALEVRGNEGRAEHWLRFDPKQFAPAKALQLSRPKFLAIASSATLASVMARKATGRVDGLIIEGSSAGGHNAPPRGALRLTPSGEPIFGERDVPDLAAIERLGLPFWLAGSWSSDGALERALAEGAAGVQVGTAFAFCAESGIAAALKQQALEQVRAGTASIRTDPLASPTGFPFKVFQLAGTLSDESQTPRLPRACDLGYLRHAYAKADGGLGWRCPSETASVFIGKGGAPEEMQGRKCVCNGLLANIGLGQVMRSGDVEQALITSGSDTRLLSRLVREFGMQYSAADVLSCLLEPRASVPARGRGEGC